MAEQNDPSKPAPQEIARLTRELEKLNAHRFVKVHNSLWRLTGFQFLRGLAFGLGSVVGATILVSLLAWWVSQFEFLPIIGDWAAQIADQIETAR
ncbi:MAG: hypothetical protein FH759_11780 [Sediminimonas qiaohouensis]|uniref:Uncharacterized protein n=1 Tax=Sediminimonas qiaohouensis TaxID=552061 RepID=A0A7C9LSV3_9RHOB|nr:DUF5665 domain-containing protein [Sediminimonas qiaohouensis]MTJ05356.1 hypothetical protein [Sediminimonas qiaohouensis]